MRTIKNLSLYTIVGFFSLGVNFVIMPILTHYLSPSDYGILSLFNSYILLTIPFIGLVASGVISIEYFNKTLGTEKFKKYFSSISFIPIIPFIIIFTLCLLFRNNIESLIEIPSKVIFLIPVLALLTIYSEQLFQFFVISKNALMYSLSIFIKVLVEVGLTLLFVIGAGMNWEGRISSLLITLSLVFILAVFYFRSKNLLTRHIKKDYVMSGLVFGTPLIMHSVGKIVVNQSDRIFISKMVSLDSVGIYNTGYLIGSVLLVLSGAFVKIYSPYLYERLADLTDIKKIEIVRISYFFMFSLSISLIGVTFFSPLIFEYFIDAKYSNGQLYVFWIGLSYFFWGLYLIFAGFLFYSKRTKTLAFLAFANVIINLILNYFLILEYGTIGAAYATVVSFMIILVAVAFKANEDYPMPWLNFKEIIYGVN